MNHLNVLRYLIACGFDVLVTEANLSGDLSLLEIIEAHGTKLRQITNLYYDLEELYWVVGLIKTRDLFDLAFIATGPPYNGGHIEYRLRLFNGITTFSLIEPLSARLLKKSEGMDGTIYLYDKSLRLNIFAFDEAAGAVRMCV